MSYVGTHAINGSLYKKLPFDPEKDFAPVATLATLPFVLSSDPDSPVKTIADLVAPAKKAGALTYGSSGNGSVNHLLGEMFNAAAGIKMLHVPYRGAAPAMHDLMGGQIDTGVHQPAVGRRRVKQWQRPRARRHQRQARVSLHPRSRRSRNRASRAST